MPDSFVYITPSKKEFSGSAFALWRLLKFGTLQKERVPIGEKEFIWIRLPIAEAEIPLLSERTSRLLLTRLERLIGHHTLCFLAPSIRTHSFFAPLSPCVASSAELFSVTSGFLPEILRCMQRQWGLSWSDSSIALMRANRPFLPIAKAVAPHTRSLTVLGNPPSYEEQDAAWEAWGLAICHEAAVPADCSLLILESPEDLPPSIPKDTRLLSISGRVPNAIDPAHLYFRLPGALSALSVPLGGVNAEILPLLLRFFYEESASFEAARRAGFSLSRIALPGGKFYS